MFINYLKVEDEDVFINVRCFRLLPSFSFTCAHFMLAGLRIAHSTPDEIAMDAECVWQGNPSIILKVRTLMGLTFPIQVTRLVKLW